MVDPEVMSTMPSDFQESHPVDPVTGLVKLTTKNSDYSTFIKYCENDVYAKKYFMARSNQAPDNEHDLQQMIELRYQKAKLLGYSSFAEYAMEVGMVSEPQTARETTLTLNERTRASSEGEKSDLSAILIAKGRELTAWNWRNATQLLLRDRFPDYNPLEARKFFSLKKVVAGAMSLLGQILSVEFRQVYGIETWHPYRASLRRF